MAARLWAAAVAPATLNPPLLTLSASSSPSSSRLRRSVLGRLRSRAPRPADFVCRRAKNAAYDDYKFPDPIPEFAAQVSNSPSVDWSFLLAAQLADSSLVFFFLGFFRRRASSRSTWCGGWSRRRMTTSGSTWRKSSTSAPRQVHGFLALDFLEVFVAFRPSWG